MVIVTTRGGLVREDLVRLAGSFGYDGRRDVVTVVSADDPRVVEAEYGPIEMTIKEILAAEPPEYKPGYKPPGATYVPGEDFSPLMDVDKMSMLLGIHIQNLRASAERAGTEWDVSWVTPPPERVAEFRNPRVFGRED